MSDSHTVSTRAAGRSISLDIGEPFTLTQTRDDDPPGWHRIHPELMRFASGRLIASANRDGDIPDGERIMFCSDDDGRSWRETTNWPTADQRGQHVRTHLLNLPGGEAVAVYAYAVFAPKNTDKALLPTWRTNDSGETWSDMAGAEVDIELDSPMNLYDPPDSLKERYANPQHAPKPQMPPAIARMAAQFGPDRDILVITDSHVFDDGRMLLFAYGPRRRTCSHGKHMSYVLESTDRGASWQHIATPGAWEDRLDNEFFLKHRTDGLCEPAVTAVDEDELLCVMRLGSRHPLYQARSRDGGRTWSSPTGMPVYGILPSLVTLNDGLVLLCSGRPDVTLSVSADGGHRWPLTYRFLEDGKPLDPSTRNNTMIKVGPQRVLFMYDLGGYHKLPEGFEGRPRIVGHFIDVTSNDHA